MWTLLDDADPSPLLEPADVAGLHLRNRLVMAPMTRQFSPGGIPGEDVAAYYRRARSSLGLLITEGTYVDHRSAGTSDRVPRFFGAEALAGWREVAGAVHAEGGAIFPQLWHLGAAAQGRQRRRFPTPRWSAPRASTPRARPSASRPARGRSRTIAASFARAAADARAAGFDGVELHGAHGYLLDQFHWPATNRRDRRVRRRRRRPGPVQRRGRRGRPGRGRPGLPGRVPLLAVEGRPLRRPDRADPAELAAFLTPLADAGVSLFHVSTRRYWQPAFEGSDRTLAGWTRHLSGLAGHRHRLGRRRHPVPGRPGRGRPSPR